LPRYRAFDCQAARRGPGIGRSRPVGGGSAGEAAIGAQIRRAIVIGISGIWSLADADVRRSRALRTLIRASGYRPFRRFGREHRRAQGVGVRAVGRCDRRTQPGRFGGLQSVLLQITILLRSPRAETAPFRLSPESFATTVAFCPERVRILFASPGLVELLLLAEVDSLKSNGSGPVFLAVSRPIAGRVRPKTRFAIMIRHLIS